jgi:hypothetical protein
MAQNLFQQGAAARVGDGDELSGIVTVSGMSSIARYFFAYVPVQMGLVAAPASPAGGALVDYGRDVWPILSNNCFYCHGQDLSGRKGRLRFDTAEG